MLSGLSGLILLFLQFFLCHLNDSLSRNAEMFIELIRRSGGAEAVHADKSAMTTQDAVPALADAGLYRDLFGSIAEQALYI